MKRFSAGLIRLIDERPSEKAGALVGPVAGTGFKPVTFKLGAGRASAKLHGPGAAPQDYGAGHLSSGRRSRAHRASGSGRCVAHPGPCPRRPVLGRDRHAVYERRTAADAASVSSCSSPASYPMTRSRARARTVLEIHQITTVLTATSAGGGYLLQPR